MESLTRTVLTEKLYVYYTNRNKLIFGDTKEQELILGARKIIFEGITYKLKNYCSKNEVMEFEII